MYFQTMYLYNNKLPNPKIPWTVGLSLVSSVIQRVVNRGRKRGGKPQGSQITKIERQVHMGNYIHCCMI